MPKLNQILAVEKTVKTTADRAFTDAYQSMQKKDMLSGISRTYDPLLEDGEKLPPESTLVQIKVGEVITSVKDQLENLFNTTAQKDWANTIAKADIAVDGTVIVSGVPVTYLLFLEKQITDLITVFVKNVPTLSPEFEWTLDGNTGVYKTDTVQTARSKKIPFNHVKAEATPEHPAQVDVYQEDKIVGYWNRTLFSGALPPTEVQSLKTRLEGLLKAVKFAREQANGEEANTQDAGTKILDYIFPVS